nr:CBS domain-containing protein [Betaproteobacteria bacterium]
MRTEGQIPSVRPEATGLEVMREMSDKGLGATAIVNSQNQPVGIFTDGDLRRLLEGGGDLRAMTAATLMRNAPHVISMDALAAEAADVMEANAVTSLLVVDGNGRLVGALNANDLMRAKVI